MAKLSFATFIFDGQSNVVVQMLRFHCVKVNKSNFKELIRCLFLEQTHGVIIWKFPNHLGYSRELYQDLYKVFCLF